MYIACLQTHQIKEESQVLKYGKKLRRLRKQESWKYCIIASNTIFKEKKFVPSYALEGGELVSESLSTQRNLDANNRNKVFS
jgi:hypothetical protein